MESCPYKRLPGGVVASFVVGNFFDRTLRMLRSLVRFHLAPPTSPIRPRFTDVYGPYVTSPDMAPEPFNQPFFLAFTQAFGMDSNDMFEPGVTPLPATMKIDWVGRKY